MSRETIRDVILRVSRELGLGVNDIILFGSRARGLGILGPTVIGMFWWFSLGHWRGR